MAFVYDHCVDHFADGDIFYLLAADPGMDVQSTWDLVVLTLKDRST